MDKQTFYKSFQKRADSEKAAKRVLLSTIEATSADNAAEVIRGISEDLAADVSTILENCRKLSVEQLARQVTQAFQATCQKNNVAKRLSEISIGDDKRRQDLWRGVTADVDIAAITDNWRRNERDINEMVLKQARQYAQRVLDLIVALNWDSDGGPALVAHQFRQEAET